MSKICDFLSTHSWVDFVASYPVTRVCALLNFSEAMHLVEHLFFGDIQDDAKQQYAFILAGEIKRYFRKDWERDWKNDIFLARLCETLWLYEERYLIYKSVYDNLENPPSELLLLLANCNSAPGSPPVSNEEAESYLLKASKKEMTFEVALAMKTHHKLKHERSAAVYWDQISKKLEAENVHSDPLIPDVLRV